VDEERSKNGGLESNAVEVGLVVALLCVVVALVVLALRMR
jgi:hypothetical protein